MRKNKAIRARYYFIEYNSYFTKYISLNKLYYDHYHNKK